VYIVILQLEDVVRGHVVESMTVWMMP
jgi:hypothetical protein